VVESVDDENEETDFQQYREGLESGSKAGHGPPKEEWLE